MNQRIIRTDLKTGVIESFKTSQDGKKRIAVLKFMIKGKITTLTRPINRLYPIKTSPHLMDEDLSKTEVCKLKEY